MDPVIFLGFSVAYVALLVFGLRAASRHGWWTPANLPLLVLAGLCYDNALLGLGHLIGEGAVLEGLNLARFWIHATVTPVLVAWALHALRRAGFGWAGARWFQGLSITISVGLMALEYLTELHDLRIEPSREYGAVSYSNAAPADGPPLMVLIVALVLAVVGVMLWRRQGWPWLFAGTVLMTVGSAVDVPVPSAAVTNAFELVLLVSALATKLFQDRVARPGARVGARS